MQQFNNFMQNPMQFLAGKNLNVPEQFQNDPKGAVQYFLNNGTISQDNYNKVMQMANKMGLKLN